MTQTPEQLAEVKRESECKARHGKSCAIVNEELGWKHLMPLQDCDRCLAAGGPQGGGGIRSELVQVFVSTVKKYPEKANKQMLEGLKKWTTPEELERLLSDPEVAWAREKSAAWQEVRPTWEKAESAIRSMLSRGITGKRVELTIKNTRHISCFGTTLDNKRVSARCPSLAQSKDGTHHFCNACGCGDTDVALLDGDGYPKLDYPYLECPRKRAGFSNSELPLVLRETIKVDADICGIGDLVYLLWLAQGARREGKEVIFYAKKDFFQSIIRMAGFEFVTDNTGVWPGGAHLPMYWEEHHNTLGRGGRLEFWASRFPGNPQPEQPTLVAPEAAKKWAKEFFDSLPAGRKFVLFFPLSIYNTRNWTRAHWLDLAYRMEEVGYTTLTLVGKGQDAFVKGTPGFPRWFLDLSIEKIVALLELADLTVAVSSGPSVIAGTMNKPTIVLSGPTQNCYKGMDSVVDLAVSQERCGCVGCSFNGDQGFSNICDLGCRAMQAITVQDVLRKVDSMMGGEMSAQVGRLSQQENKIHPHVPEERADLFTAADSGSTETEYLELLASLVRVLKPVQVLEVGAYKGRGTLTLARALKKNGIAYNLNTLEKDPDLAHKLEHTMGSYGLLPVTVYPQEAMDFFRQYKEPPCDFVFLDSFLENRGNELRTMVEFGVLKAGSVVVIHDTSRMRTTREGHPDERTAMFYASMQDLWGKFEGFEFPLSRGMLLLRYKGV